MKRLHFTTVDSTNTYALRHLDDLEDRTVITADFQTKARGRFQREWLCKEGNLYLTFVLKPLKNYHHLSSLTQYLCVSLAKTLEKYNVKPQIKWANDILINDAKIAGILCESSIKSSVIKGLALGIGVNLNLDKESLLKISQKAASLNIETGKVIDKEKFINLLIEEFFTDYENFLEKGFILIKDDYEKRNNFLNKEIFVSNNGEKVPCYAKTVNEDGSLTVIEKDGTRKIIFSGDISL